jgi:hypothetical protein
MSSQIRMALLISRDLVFAVTDMRTGLAESASIAKTHLTLHRDPQRLGRIVKSRQAAATGAKQW